MPVFIAEREKERQRCLSCQIIIIALSSRRNASESEYMNRRRRRKRKRRRRQHLPPQIRHSSFALALEYGAAAAIGSSLHLPISILSSPLSRERERKVKHLEEACTKCVPNNTYERDDEGRKKKGLSNNAVVSSLYDAKSV